LNKSRRKFLGKGSAVALAAGVGVASGKIAMASPPTPVEGTRQLLDAVIAGQGKYNGFLYVSGDLLLEVLRMVVPHVSGIDVAAATAKLDRAEGYLDKVPGKEPPYCELPPDWNGGGYGGGD
jgi:hypothetical protein